MIDGRTSKKHWSGHRRSRKIWREGINRKMWESCKINLEKQGQIENWNWFSICCIEIYQIFSTSDGSGSNTKTLSDAIIVEGLDLRRLLMRTKSNVLLVSTTSWILSSLSNVSRWFVEECIVPDAVVSLGDVQCYNPDSLNLLIAVFYVIIFLHVGK